MAFNIVLQKNNSEKNCLDKNISNITTLSGVLKNETSIINPTILVEGSLSTISNCNYMTIDAFNRSYFITDIVSKTNSLIEISAHCDVLSSFKEGIRSNRGIVKKQSNEYNLYLNDGTFKVNQNKKVFWYKSATTDFSVTGDYVLSVLG